MGKDDVTVKVRDPISRDTNRRPPPIHPGEFLREEFLIPLGLSANALALALRVPATRISEILRERRGVSADTAFRLSLYFDTTAEFWLNMQTSYELSVIHHGSLAQIKKEVKRRRT